MDRHFQRSAFQLVLCTFIGLGSAALAQAPSQPAPRPPPVGSSCAQYLDGMPTPIISSGWTWVQIKSDFESTQKRCKFLI